MTFENQQPPHLGDRYKTLLIFLAILNTVWVVLLAALQSDAGIRAAQSDRDSQYYAVIASGELHRSGLTSNFDFMVLTETLKNQQENLVLMMTALEQQMQGQAQQAEFSRTAASAAQAQAEVGQKFSILYSDPRFKPKDALGLPNVTEYLAVINSKANELVTKQNRAADAYHLWSQKSDDYAMILTIISIAFLLLGIGQAISITKLRLFFAILGGLIQFICVLWTMVILIK